MSFDPMKLYNLNAQQTIINGLQNFKDYSYFRPRH